MSTSYPPSPMTNGSSGGPSTEPLKTISSRPSSSSSSSSDLSALSVAEVDSEGYHIKPNSVSGNGIIKNKGKGKSKDEKDESKGKNKNKNNKRPLNAVDSEEDIDSEKDKDKVVGKKAKTVGKKDKATEKKAKNAEEVPVEGVVVEEEGEEEEEVKGAYCHQCRTRSHPDEVLRCTRLKQFSRQGPPRACNRAYCDNCLMRRYGMDPEDIRQLGGEDDGEGHVENVDWGYMWTCPCCDDICQNSVEEKKVLNPSEQSG
ncbi:hypothetical protein BCR39DRAFT_357621 [Naematelia encephala]|uniref:Zinc-finger domain-containing protein n=1 Tax=Naematelia encephala TaxID=71784 RepID=A0A1Y2BDI1_9TREE|nr:hypothetical protein BCR39DRAFT_357621 [Naematelia encephala]